MVFFITGLYSRGKSHVLHLSVPTEHLLTFWNSMETMVDTQPQEVADDSDDTGVIPSQVQPSKESVEEGSHESVSGSDDENAIARDNLEDSAFYFSPSNKHCFFNCALMSCTIM